MSAPKPKHPLPAHIELRQLSEVAMAEHGIDRAQALSLARLVRQGREDAQGFHRSYMVTCATCGTTHEPTSLALRAAQQILRHHRGHATSVWTTDAEYHPTVADDNGQDLPVGDNVVTFNGRGSK